MEAEKKLVGWLERIDLPDWGIHGLIAKVDTGANTSAIHVENITLVDEETLRFDVILKMKRPHLSVPVTTKIFRRAVVRSSTGNQQERYIVQTHMKAGDVEKLIEVSLVSRKKMVRRMLLGRRALSGDFLVDTSRTFLLKKD